MYVIYSLCKIGGESDVRFFEKPWSEVTSRMSRALHCFLIVIHAQQRDRYIDTIITEIGPGRTVYSNFYATCWAASCSIEEI